LVGFLLTIIDVGCCGHVDEISVSAKSYYSLGLTEQLLAHKTAVLQELLVCKLPHYKCPFYCTVSFGPLRFGNIQV